MIFSQAARTAYCLNTGLIHLSYHAVEDVAAPGIKDMIKKTVEDYIDKLK